MNNNLTEIIFLLDRSGSMGGFESDTIGGFNSFIKRQSEVKGETIVTTVLFDDQYEILWNGIEVHNAYLTDREYYVRGCTALLDAVGKTIINVDYRLSHTDENKRPNKVIFVITTDGLENASREFNYSNVKKMIHEKQEKKNWDFIFLGANIDVEKEADNMGIHINNSYSFEASEKGLNEMYDKACHAVFEKRNETTDITHDAPRDKPRDFDFK